MRRRDFVRLLGAAFVWPLVARAQHPGRVRRVPNVGILNYAAAEDMLVSEFRSALASSDTSRGRRSQLPIVGPTDASSVYPASLPNSSRAKLT